jgi:hydroxymethylpyrimidine pyrophosphatase-like HAD family hydrolase
VIRGFKAIAVDLDGTLLDTRGAPHVQDVRALRAAARAGVHVSILTGRLYSGTRASAEAIGITGPVGCADGSHMVRASDHATLAHHGLSGEHARVVRDALGRHGPATFIFAQDAIVHDAVGEAFLGYVKTWSTDVRLAESVVAHDWWTSAEGITAVVAVGTAAQIHGAHEEIVRSEGTEAYVVTFPIRRLTDAWGMIARAPGRTKGSALAFVAEHYGYGPEQVVCVGDWMNDLSMFDVAGRSYAMGHAPDDVKGRASVVLEETSERGGGIARAIEDAFGIRAEGDE